MRERKTPRMAQLDTDDMPNRHVHQWMLGSKINHALSVGWMRCAMGWVIDGAAHGDVWGQNCPQPCVFA